MARKCGNCHKNNSANKTHAPRVISFAEEVQPISGGIAPGIAPIAVEAEVFVFSGV